MQAQAAQSIISDINAHMRKSGIINANWYVGITCDIDERLFGFHNVPRNGHWFIYRQAFDDTDARNVESAYHRAGCKGSGGGGDETAVFVYAYVISQHTVE
jgi:hypothetical protein